ncbi:hypothetical protein HYC85_002604 [Camellia sinensis]|uniref:Uncharacterized protein n=1 Tax=Camellia sinensis TaxID=4442 RepID=A0A7J7I975_CAMSI|nr:hypothetical protein HYC85_002604 [Camellia sinensis]
MPIQSILIFFFIIVPPICFGCFSAAAIPGIPFESPPIFRSLSVFSNSLCFAIFSRGGSNNAMRFLQFSVKGQTARRLSKPLIRDDGKIYSCSERNLFAFESNGSIAWTVNLNYICNVGIAPIHGGSRKLKLAKLL